MSRPDHPMDQASKAARTEFGHAADPEREQRRKDFMEKRKRPTPVHRPSHDLAYGPDGTGFDTDWRAAHKAARTRQR